MTVKRRKNQGAFFANEFSSSFLMVGQHYAAIWKAIIRPPRDLYNLKDLGPAEFIVCSYLTLHYFAFPARPEKSLPNGPRAPKLSWTTSEMLSLSTIP